MQDDDLAPWCSGHPGTRPAQSDSRPPPPTQTSCSPQALPKRPARCPPGLIRPTHETWRQARAGIRKPTHDLRTASARARQRTSSSPALARDLRASVAGVEVGDGVLEGLRRFGHARHLRHRGCLLLRLGLTGMRDRLTCSRGGSVQPSAGDSLLRPFHSSTRSRSPARRARARIGPMSASWLPTR